MIGKVVEKTNMNLLLRFYLLLFSTSSCNDCFINICITIARVVEQVDTPDLEDNLSAKREIFWVELRKFGEPFKMGIPSQASKDEGVETRHGEPKS